MLNSPPTAIAARYPRSGLPLPVPLELMLTTLKRVGRFAAQSGFNLPSLVYLFASILEKSGCRHPAARLYEKALVLADGSSSRRIFKVRQAWEFEAEKNRSRQGAARVDDPLFRVVASPDPTSAKRFPRRLAAGYYEAQVCYRGLRIDGYLRPGVDGGEIEVFIDGKLIRRTSVSRVFRGLSLFVVYIMRDAIAALPPHGKLELRLAGGESLLFEGCATAELSVPHASGIQGYEKSPVQIDKKGFLVRPTQDVAQLQRGFLNIYVAASRFFESELGVSLFVLYGTLLGQHRNGDFIPGDDDFDVGYYSDARTSTAVRSQGMDFVVKLVRAGFVVTLNREGRLFRLRLPGMPPHCHLDVHAVWRERGSLWIHPRANLDCNQEDFVPASSGKLLDVEVAVPARPEAFLASYYGADWRVPDPAYSTAARSFPFWKTCLLRRSCVTPVHVKEMQDRISLEADVPNNPGMLLAIGVQSIYPLERYDALCDW